MCGIAGFAGNGDKSDLERMMRAIAHRGPDGEGIHVDQHFALYLGHLRLSIVDLKDGAQPMWNEDGTVAVIFNGEIYNHAELRRELEASGHHFATDHSDTEVLVHGWEEWGEGLPLRLNGMFGFAIWDKSKKTIFLARDRYGEKPLYWGRQNGTFFFASELSSIAAHNGFQVSFDPTALKKYFAHGFVPSPNAIYRDTHKLFPGHWLRFDVGSGDIVSRAYWQFRMAPSDHPPTLDEAAEEVRALLLQSVKRRLMSDVPLGVFLSGGVDSSFATAAMCQHREAPDVNSFAVGFQEKSFDESGHARAMAAALGTTHHESILDLDVTRNILSEVLGRLDEPLGDGSILPTYMLCRFARSRVKVALSGDGGDELFAGYDPFSALKPAALYHAIVPDFAHRGMRRLADLLPKSAANMSFDFKLRRVLQGLSFGPELWTPVWLAPLEPDDIKSLFNEPINTDELYSEVLALWHEDPAKSTVNKTLEFYSNFYLPDDILTKVDRAAMLNGLEVRSIFLDNDLVEYARHLPASFKFDGSNRKIVLKKAAQGLLPQSILDRPKKGFGVPLKTWLNDLALSKDGADGLGMDEDEIAARIHRHQTGRADHRLFLWNWTVLKEFSKNRHCRSFENV
ncbi:MAG: asparagine synthase (glutamine-hydrolyzing) [Pseudomonadota bacterium]|nr:asparagine synthase (glutamine-hydrolyzing) [Pseudomonadota bacterium]